jgi:glycine dehydrogenase subunit 1
MLASIGVPHIESLFDEIPQALRAARLTAVPPRLGEMDVMRLMQERAQRDGRWLNFIGAGAYEHHIPAAVWQIVTRGEFYSAYTPYQAEASQGTLQVLYEYQSMMASLTGLDATNASLYDGASALAEAILMAVRLHKSSHRVLIPATVHPTYVKVVRTIVSSQDIELIELPYCAEQGVVLPESLQRFGEKPFAALVIPQPNFFGALEQVHALTDWAHARAALVIGAVNPVALALLAPPGRWGKRGADIAVGEGQPLGALASGGHISLGLQAGARGRCRRSPGVLDLDDGPVPLTLQAREQHIRRRRPPQHLTNKGWRSRRDHSRAAGAQGLRASPRPVTPTRRRCSIDSARRGVRRRSLHRCSWPSSRWARATRILERMREQRVLGGRAGRRLSELADSILVCATETKTQAISTATSSVDRRPPRELI